MTTTSYNVSGMSCQHCVNAVSTEIAKLPGVTGVSVDLATGSVAVTSAAQLADADVAAAVDEAGYELVDAGTDPPRPG
jgi:copper chaperone